MGTGLHKTFEILAKTDNEAAVRTLVAALDSPHAPYRLAAFRALLARRSVAGHRELIRRFGSLPPEWREIVRSNATRLGRALRDAVVSTDPQLGQGGCQAAVFFRDYELIPALLTALEDQANSRSEHSGRALLELVESLHAELSGSGPCEPLRDPWVVREQVMPALEASFRRFARHRRRETIAAFVLLTQRDNAVFREILDQPHHAAYAPLMETLGQSEWTGVMQLLVDTLDEPRAPSALLKLVSQRSDAKFVRLLLQRIARSDSPTVATNLKRIRTMWICGESNVLDKLDETAQRGAVRLVMVSLIPRLQAFGVIERLLRCGKPAARCDAVEALAEFFGAQANALAMAALVDPDPGVQAKVLPQLRRRGIPSALRQIVKLADSPHAVVRDAVREALDEFSFPRFLAAFDTLDEPVRRSTGTLVKKLNPRTAELLEAELRATGRTRRLRGLAVAESLDLLARLEPTIVTMLDDVDPAVSCAAASVLSQCTTPPA